jgi:hypothetical protein
VDLNKGEEMMSNIDCYTSSWLCFIHKFWGTIWGQRIPGKQAIHIFLEFGWSQKIPKNKTYKLLVHGVCWGRGKFWDREGFENTQLCKEKDYSLAS